MLQAEYATMAYATYEDAPGRCTPNLPPHIEDCSGVQTYGLHQADVATPQPCMDSRSLRAWCAAAGTMMTHSEAEATAGSLCFLGSPGGEHHVAVSTGDGRVFAARGIHVTPHIGFSRFDVDPWNSFGWPPGLTRTPLADPLPGPVASGEAAAMGMVAGVVPGAHAQQHPQAWAGHAPFVGCQQQKDGHWHMIGFNGAELLDVAGLKATNGFGVSVVDLGPLNGPIVDKSEPKDGDFAGKLVFLADDGGTFSPLVQVHYPTS